MQRRLGTEKLTLRFKDGSERRVLIYQGDITKFEGDAIVNAVDPNMLGGSGVFGAIHYVAGAPLMRACKLYEPFCSASNSFQRCPYGHAKVTMGFSLPAKWVVHTAGPAYDDSTAFTRQQSEFDLVVAYKNSLAVANNLGCKTIAFSEISCGGLSEFPKYDSAKLALIACAKSMGDVQEAHFILFKGAECHEAFVRAAHSCISENIFSAGDADDASAV